MALSDIQRDNVLFAIAECNQLGRKYFRTTYGCQRSNSYFLIYEGKEYDSEAIFVAAHQNAKPDLGVISPTEFFEESVSGNRERRKIILQKLQELRFESVRAKRPGQSGLIPENWIVFG